MMSAVEKRRAGIAAGVLNASRQSGSAFGVAIFGALTSTAQTQREGVRVAVIVAISLSLVAAVCWRVASHPNDGDARQRGVRPADPRVE